MCLNHKHLTYDIIKQILTYDVVQYGFYGSLATIFSSASPQSILLPHSIKLHIVLITDPYLYIISKDIYRTIMYFNVLNTFLVFHPNEV